MKYLITKIQEADYGCEERPADYVPQALLKLKDESGQESYREVPDADLYKLDIREGDRITFTQDNHIQKEV